MRENKLQTMNDVQSALKELFAETLQSMLKAELDMEFGYEKHNIQNKMTSYSRNGKTKKTVISEYGEWISTYPRVA